MPPTDPLSLFLVHRSSTLRDRLRDGLRRRATATLAGWADTEDGAVRALSHLPVDLVMVDVTLRQGSGFAVMEFLRDRAKRLAARAPTIVVVTSYAFPEFEIAARLRGAHHFVDRRLGLGPILGLIARLASGRAVAAG